VPRASGAETPGTRPTSRLSSEDFRASVDPRRRGVKAVVEPTAHATVGDNGAGTVGHADGLKITKSIQARRSS
jgi:hypothetical protein